MCFGIKRFPKGSCVPSAVTPDVFRQPPFGIASWFNRRKCGLRAGIPRARQQIKPCLGKDTGPTSGWSQTIRRSYDAPNASDNFLADTDFQQQSNAPTLRRDHEL